MKTSNLTVGTTEMESIAKAGISPPNKKIQVDNPDQFTEGDEDEFDIPLDADLDNLDGIGLDDDDDDF